MKCPKCGAELTEDTKFCSFCGEKIESEPEENVETNNEQVETPAWNGKPEPQKTSIADKIKEKGKGYWNRLSIFGKIVAVAIVLFALLGLVAFLSGKTLAGVIAVIQIALIVVVILLKKQIIKAPKTWLYIVSFALAVLLLVPYFSLIGQKKIDAEKYSWSDIAMSEVIPEPKSHRAKIVGNSDEYLTMYVYKTSQGKYNDYVEACEEKGFTIDVEQLDSNSFDAYNETGYKLSLVYFAKDEKMDISVDAPVKLGILDWPTDGLSQFIPVPTSSNGKIDTNDEMGFRATIGDTSIEDMKVYTKSCSDMGFSVDLSETEKSFFAKNSDGYKLTIDYIGFNTISVSIEQPEYNVSMEVVCEENWIFSKYNVEIFIDELSEGTLTHGSTETYSNILKKGVHTVKFVSDEDDTVTGEVSIDVAQDENYKFEISCSSTGIKVKTIAGAVVGAATETESSSETEATTSEDVIEATSEEAIDDSMVSLEVNIAQEMAERAVIVAMTNSQATDVFTSDGNSYDTAKFHSYSDIDDFFMSVDTEGTWTAKDEITWHLEGLILKIHGYDTFLKVSCDVTQNEDNYVVSNVDKKIASKYYLDSDDNSKINEEHLEPSDFNSFLTVTPELVKDDRDTNAENSKVTAETQRQEWIDNQFSWWDNSHTELQKLIKKSLNDEKSYKFIDSSYIDVSDEEKKEVVNSSLKELDVSERVEVGDLLVIMDFSAKNAYNATIKSQAYGIVRYSDNSTILVWIQ